MGLLMALAQPGQVGCLAWLGLPLYTGWPGLSSTPGWLTLGFWPAPLVWPPVGRPDQGLGQTRLVELPASQYGRLVLFSS